MKVKALVKAVEERLGEAKKLDILLDVKPKDVIRNAYFESEYNGEEESLDTAVEAALYDMASHGY